MVETGNMSICAACSLEHALPRTYGFRAGEGASIDELPATVSTFLPLGVLRLDARSAQNDLVSEAEIDVLADRIELFGLLCNLVVLRYERPWRIEDGGLHLEYTHGVVGGARHWRALHRLVERGVITLDEPVLCIVVPEDRAAEVSLAAGLGQRPLSLADTVQGFAAVVASSGASVESIASSFGLPVLTVQRYLKLACVSPRLFALFRAGELTQEQMQALTLADTHAAQEAAWDGLAACDRVPGELRRVILGKGAPRRLVRFVGIEVYEQAGGDVVVDLFAEPGEEGAGRHVRDAALLTRLAMEKLTAMAQSLREQEGWAWVDVELDYVQEVWERYRDAPTTRSSPSAEQVQAMDALRKQVKRLDRALEALYAQGPDEPADDRMRRMSIDTLEVQSQRYETLLHDMEVQLRKCAPDLAPLVGAMLVLNREGGVLVRRNLIRQVDWREAKAIQRRSAIGV